MAATDVTTPKRLRSVDPAWRTACAAAEAERLELVALQASLREGMAAITELARHAVGARRAKRKAGMASGLNRAAESKRNQIIATAALLPTDRALASRVARRVGVSAAYVRRVLKADEKKRT